MWRVSHPAVRIEGEDDPKVLGLIVRSKILRMIGAFPARLILIADMVKEGDVPPTVRTYLNPIPASFMTGEKWFPAVVIRSNE